jgi:hypothetical protein
MLHRITAPLGFVTALLLSIHCWAGPFGAGIIIFGPTGFSANYNFSKAHSLDAALAWSMNDDDQKFYFHSTYLWKRPNFFRIDKVQLNTHWGVGGRVISWDDPPGRDRESEVRLGVRGSGGVSYVFPNHPVELFGELALTMDLIPETDADLHLGLGARYYF